MTKAELEKDRDEWKQQAESLQEDIYGLNEYINELENQLADLSNKKSEQCISNLDDFIYRLKDENLYSKELEDFLTNYMKYYREEE